METQGFYNWLESILAARPTRAAIMSRALSELATPPKNHINSLPTDVLGRIFLFVMTPLDDPKELNPEAANDDLVFSTSVPITPIPLTQTCLRWKHVAQNTSQLWRSIRIGRPSKRILPRVYLWMQCAESVPLSIDFHQSEPESSDDMEAAGEIIQLLCSRWEQWSEVKFHLHQDVFPSALVSIFQLISKISWSVLKVAVISNSYSFTASQHAVILAWTSLNRINSLEALKWCSSDIVPRPSSTTLQSLTINGIKCRELIEGVTACVSLRELDARVDFGHNPSFEELTSVRQFRHNHLQHIALRGESRNIGSFLHCFTLPRLVSVELTPVSAASCENLRRLLERSNAHLKRLMLQVYGVDGDALAEMLEWPALATLETLVITGADVTDAAILKLTVFSAALNYFENLEHLSLSACSAEMDEGAFLRMLGSRLFTPYGEPAKLELMTGAFIVKNKSPAMKSYEETVVLPCIKANYPKHVDSKRWNDRTFIIQQQI